MAAPTLPNFPLHCGRFTLRPVRASDLDAIHSYRSLATVAAYLPHEPHNRGQTAGMLAAMVEQASMEMPGDWLDLAVEMPDSRQVVGEVLLKRDAAGMSSGEVGFVFAPSVHGSGLATKAVEAVLRLAFEQFQWDRVTGICDARNIRSAALMTRLGMRREAEFIDAVVAKGQWVSKLHFAILRDEWVEGMLSLGQKWRQEESDKREIDRLATDFFDAFTSPDSGPADLNRLRSMFVSGASVMKVADQTPVLCDVDSFIEPREALLNSGRLRGFSEQEITTTTEVFGDIAQRWSVYSKSGILDDAPYTGWGRKAMHFARTSGGWRISAIAWHDDPDDTPLPRPAASASGGYPANHSEAHVLPNQSRF